MQKFEKQLADILKPHQALVVVGGNWGDEGKGKIIDLVMKHYDVAVRFSGGANAGHTVYSPGGVKIVGHLIPCGLAQDKECVLARGEFIDIRLFLEELDKARQDLGELPKVWLDEMSPLWTPYHALLETWLEQCRGATKVGTTGKGIGPLEGIYKLRISPTVGQLFLERGEFVGLLQTLHQALLPVFEKMKERDAVLVVPSPEEAADQLLALASRLKDVVVDTSFVLSRLMAGKKRLLFEGAQALGLDSHWGTYPFVSSGNSAAAGAAIGTGLPMQKFGATVMVAKVLPTRVGRGPFPSEMWEREAAMKFAKENPTLFAKGENRDKFLAAALEKINQGKSTDAEMSQYFQVLGDERGATTGRGRSVGFLDIPWLQYAVRVNGPSYLALTRFDMLSKIKTIPVVAGYEFEGKLLEPGKMPSPWQMEKIKTVREEWPCWEEDISGINNEKDLPKGAKDFLLKLENLVGVPILMTGTGPGRDAIVIRG